MTAVSPEYEAHLADNPQLVETLKRSPSARVQLGSLATKIELSTKGQMTLSAKERLDGYSVAKQIHVAQAEGRFLPNSVTQDAGYVVTHRFAPEIKKAQEEDIEDPIVLQNLLALEANIENLANEESLGANAGRMTIAGREFNLTGINGYMDRHTGLITAFGNSQSVDQETIDNDAQFSLKMATFAANEGLNANSYDGRIVAVIPRDETVEPEAQDRLRQAVLHYNEQVSASKQQTSY